MAHSVSARKRVRQNANERARNRWRLKAMRDAIREFEVKVAAAGTADELKAAFHKAQKVIDRTASKGTIHRNQAARRKSRLNAKLTGKATAPAKPASKTARAKA
jgi:small subunit ribosomal protein S20